MQLSNGAIQSDFKPVGVVDKGIEALIEPLPEDDGRSRLVESHHTSSNNHVKRNLLKSYKKGNKVFN